MCGIFAYVGGKNASSIIVKGLKRLEYRGYDSWGVAVLTKNQLKVAKQVGPIGDLNKALTLPSAHMGIGHTRWATHGGVTELNAHPHFSSDKSFVVAQNGIVENYQELKKKLQSKGYTFQTETDTEVIVRLIEAELVKEPNLSKAVKSAFLKLKGRNTIIVLSQKKQEIIAIRHGSPLVIGVGKAEYIFASDTLSFANLTNKVIFINDFEMVHYANNQIKVVNTKTNKTIKYKITKLDQKDIQISKQGYDSYYLKEVLEQPQTIKTATLYTKAELNPLIETIKKSKKIYLLGAGTASFVAGQGAYFFRQLVGLDAQEIKAYEIESYLTIFKKGEVLIAVSQSGETADTLEAVNLAKLKGLTIVSIVNMMGSTLSRISDFPFYTRSGPEISVVSTKAFTAQMSWLLMLAYYLNSKEVEFKTLINQVSQKAKLVTNKSYLNKIAQIAKKLVKHEHIYVLGRNENYYLALEGALKIKEITYIHAEGFSSGELKHGVIALISKNTPVFGIVSNTQPETVLNALAEVKARGAWVLGIGQTNNDLFHTFLPIPNLDQATSLLNIIPFQLLGYYLAKLKGYSPDKPRNLAKSVTVK